MTTSFVQVDLTAPRYFRLKDEGVFKVVKLAKLGADAVLTCGTARRGLLVHIEDLWAVWQDDRLVFVVETLEFRRVFVIRLVKNVFQISWNDVPHPWRPVALLGEIVYFDNMQSRCAKLNLLTKKIDWDFETGNLAAFAERESLRWEEHLISMVAVTSTYAVYEMVRMDHQYAVVVVPDFDFDRAFIVFWKMDAPDTYYADDDALCLVYIDDNEAYVLWSIKPGMEIELVSDVFGHLLNYLVMGGGDNRLVLYDLKTGENVAVTRTRGFNYEWLECEDLTGLVWVAPQLEVSFLPGLRVVNWAATEGKVTIKDLPEVLGRRIYGMVEARSLTGLVVGTQTVNVQAMIV